MPRRSSFSSSRSPPTRSAAARPAPRPAPAPQAPAQPQTGTSSGFGSGLLGTVATGMAFGAGSEIAHQAVRGIMGGSSRHEAQEQSVPTTQDSSFSFQSCQMEQNNFTDCLKFNPKDIQACQSYADLLQQCQKNKN